MVIGPLLRGDNHGRLGKSIATRADIRQKLEENSEAVSHLDALFVNETQFLKDREARHLTRKINGGNVAALILVAVAGGGIVYGLVSVAIASIGKPVLFWLFMVVAGLVGLFAIALTSVGLGTLYEPPREKSR